MIVEFLRFLTKRKTKSTTTFKIDCTVFNDNIHMEYYIDEKHKSLNVYNGLRNDHSNNSYYVRNWAHLNDGKIIIDSLYIFY